MDATYILGCRFWAVCWDSVGWCGSHEVCCCWNIFVMALFTAFVILYVDAFNSKVFAIAVKVFVVVGVFVVLVLGLLLLR